MVRLNSTRTGRTLLFVAVLAIVTVSPVLQNVSATFFFDDHVLLRGKSDPALRTLLATPTARNEEQMNVLVTFSNVPSAEQLRRLSELATLEGLTDHVATMHVRPSLLPEIASLDFVDHIYSPRRLTAKLDRSVPEILGDQAWALRDSAGNSVNGTGVVVGIVDTGIDYKHRDFFFPNGTSKILYIWDQSVDGYTPNGFDYGNECNHTDIQMGICSEIDGVTNGEDPGHGTAVAAVAASSGESANLFDSCLRYDGTTWQDDAQLCVSDPAPQTSFVLLSSSSDYRYFGNQQKFSQIFFDVRSPGAYGGFKWEYSQASGQWASLDVQLNQTSNLAKSGTVFFTPPADWTAIAVNGRPNQYWIRLKADGVQQAASIGHVQANPPYRGVAPGALIIAVKIRDGTDQSILDGVNYIIRKSRELGLPFVINDSFADILGSHDGTEPLELAFTDLAAEGVPIVVVAGNERNGNIHVHGRLNPGQSVTVPWSNGGAQNHYVDIWYSVNDVLGITVTTPEGISVTGPTPESGVTTLDGNVMILPDKRNTGKEWFINVTTTSALGQTQIWSYNMTGITVSDGTWDAWTTPGQFSPTTQNNQAYTPPPALYKIDPSDTIDYPGNSRGVITVGAYTTKFYWRSGCTSCIDYTTSNGYRGVWWSGTTTQEGEITAFSGMGPTRDGRTKPEIVAPGDHIATARASNSPQRNSDPDNYHQVYRGTSVAAPHVVGVIALMLQMNHYLSPNEIRSILTEDARQDQFTGKIDKHLGSPLWGWGKVNALDSTRDATSLYSVTIQIGPIEKPLMTTVTLDGQNIAMVSLNSTRPIVLEFQRDGKHTVTLTPVIQLNQGVRYALANSTLQLSSGSMIQLRYKVQFFLQVNSAYGVASGGGWYDANSTAVVSVYPTATEGHQFDGWIGSVVSNSPTISMVMDSSKNVTAIWREVAVSTMSLVGFIVAVIFSIGIAIVVRQLQERGKRKPSSG